MVLKMNCTLNQVWLIWMHAFVMKKQLWGKTFSGVTHFIVLGISEMFLTQQDVPPPPYRIYNRTHVPSMIGALDARCKSTVGLVHVVTLSSRGVLYFH